MMLKQSVTKLMVLRESHMLGKYYMQGKPYLIGTPASQTIWLRPIFSLKSISRNDCCITGRCYEMVGCVDPDDISARLFKVRKNYYQMIIYINWDFNSRLLVRYGIRLRMSVSAVNVFPIIISWRQHQSNQIQAILVILLQHVLPMSDS